MFHVSEVSVDERRRVSTPVTMHLPACTAP